MKLNKKQFSNFKKICKKTDEVIPFLTDAQLKENIESVISTQGYWSGMVLRYYLEGNDWRTETR